MFPEIQRLTTAAYVRLLHASPDAPVVDVYANGSLIATNLSFGQLTNYVCVAPGIYRLTVFAAGTTAAPVIDTTVPITARTSLTAAAVGFLANINLQVIPEPPVYLTYNNSLIRFVHLAPNAPPVDVILPDGTVLFQNVPYENITNYIPLAIGNYTLQVRVSGTSQIVLTVPNVYLVPGMAYTVFAIGLLAGTPPLQALLAIDGNSFLR